MEYLLPTSFDEIEQTIKAKIREKYGITDTQYEGSNISILASIMAYTATMINSNMNFGINESILSKATTRRNIVTHARELGYEPQFRRSYKYEIRLKAKRGGNIEIPKFAKFSAGDKNFYYLDDTKTELFGENCYINVNNMSIFENLDVRKGNTPGDFVLSDENELFEVLDKENSSSTKRIFLNSVSQDKLSVYSSKKTDLYFIEPTPEASPDDSTQDGDTEIQARTQAISVPLEYKKLGTLETYVVDETNPDEKILIAQLKDIVTENVPQDLEEFKKYKFFTDDVLKGHIIQSFDGFVMFEFNINSNIMKFKIQDNTITDKWGKEYTMYDMITPFKKKRFCLMTEDNTELKYNKDLEFCVLQKTEEVKETSIIVTEGNLISWKDTKELERLVDNEDVKNGYLALDFQGVEEDGIFLEISRVNKDNELVLHQPFYRRKTHLAESSLKVEDTTFLALEDFSKNFTFLKIYTRYSGTGTQFHVGNIFYFTLLLSSGTKGNTKELMTSTLEDFEVIPFYKDENNPENNINHKLFSNGSDEETPESVKHNAPLFKNIAQRLVTKQDYKTFCNKFQFIEQSQVWGGEELDEGKMLGHVYFSFIPQSRSKEYQSDVNNNVFELKNKYERDLFYLPTKQILDTENGGVESSIFNELNKQKIITLQFHYNPPSYLDFSLQCNLIKYLSSKTEKEQRQMVFDGIREYFDTIEKFDTDIFASNIIKFVDRKFNNETGINLKVNLEASMELEDFYENGFNETETTTPKYVFQTLFEFPIGGIFEEDQINHGGVITSYGALRKDRIPKVKSDKDGFLNPLDEIIMDFDNITYFVVEKGELKEKVGTADDINSSIARFFIPLKHKADNKDDTEAKQFGFLKVFPKSSMMYLEINATKSITEADLEKQLPLETFSTRRRLIVENDGNMNLRRNTFPRLLRVEVY